MPSFAKPKATVKPQGEMEARDFSARFHEPVGPRQRIGSPNMFARFMHDIGAATVVRLHLTRLRHLQGPLGIVWTQTIDATRREVAVVKSVKPGSAGENQMAGREGAVLGFINGDWVKGLDYFECIKRIRESR